MDLDRAEEGGAGETEATTDAGEDSCSFGGGLAVGNDAEDMDLFRAPVGEGAHGAVVAVGDAVAAGGGHRRCCALSNVPLGGECRPGGCSGSDSRQALGGAPGGGAGGTGGVAWGLEAEILCDHAEGKILARGARADEGHGGGDAG